MLKRGRPKGNTFSVIGKPVRKKKKNVAVKNPEGIVIMRYGLFNNYVTPDGCVSIVVFLFNLKIEVKLGELLLGLLTE